MEEIPVYYNANTIAGRSRHLFPIPLRPEESEVEVYVTFRHEVIMVKQTHRTNKFFWLQTNEMPDEILLSETPIDESVPDSYIRIAPSKISLNNLLNFLELLSLKQ
jgi:hypothetical protein